MGSGAISPESGREMVDAIRGFQEGTRQPTEIKPAEITDDLPTHTRRFREAFNATLEEPPARVSLAQMADPSTPADLPAPPTVQGPAQRAVAQAIDRGGADLPRPPGTPPEQPLPPSGGANLREARNLTRQAQQAQRQMMAQSTPAVTPDPESVPPVTTQDIRLRADPTPDEPPEAVAQRAQRVAQGEGGGLFANLGRGLSVGGLGLAESTGTILNYLGNITGIDAVANMGTSIEEFFQPRIQGFAERAVIPDGNVFENPELLLDGDFLTYQIGQIIPSLFATLTPIGLTRAAVRKLAMSQLARRAGVAGTVGGAAETEVLKKGALTAAQRQALPRRVRRQAQPGRFLRVGGRQIDMADPLVQAKMARIGRAAIGTATAVGGIAGGMLEGSQTYRETLNILREQGVPEDVAQSTANNAFLMMTAASGILNSAGAAALLAPIKTPHSLAAGAGLRLLGGLVEGLTEYLEGPAEAMIMLGQETITVEQAFQKFKDETNVLLPATIVGMLVPGAGANFVTGRPGDRPLGDAEEAAASTQEGEPGEKPDVAPPAGPAGQAVNVTTDEAIGTAQAQAEEVDETTVQEEDIGTQAAAAAKETPSAETVQQPQEKVSKPRAKPEGVSGEGSEDVQQPDGRAERSAEPDRQEQPRGVEGEPAEQPVAAAAQPVTETTGASPKVEILDDRQLDAAFKDPSRTLTVEDVRIDVVTSDELRTVLQNNDLPVSGNKAAQLQRLVDNQVSEAEAVRVKLTTAQASALEVRTDGGVQVDGLTIEDGHLVVTDFDAAVDAINEASNAEDAQAIEQNDKAARGASKALSNLLTKVNAQRPADAKSEKIGAAKIPKTAAQKGPTVEQRERQRARETRAAAIARAQSPVEELAKQSRKDLQETAAELGVTVKSRDNRQTIAENLAEAVRSKQSGSEPLFSSTPKDGSPNSRKTGDERVDGFAKDLSKSVVQNKAAPQQVVKSDAVVQVSSPKRGTVKIEELIKRGDETPAQAAAGDVLFETTQIADKNDVTLTVTPTKEDAADQGMKVAELRQFYEAAGFVAEQGNAGTLTRPPSGTFDQEAFEIRRDNPTVQRPVPKDAVGNVRRHLKRLAKAVTGGALPAGNARTVLKDKDGTIVVGQQKPRDKVKQIRDNFESTKEFRTWYRDVRKVFHQKFGSERADELMVGWLMANKNESPSGAMRNLLNADEKSRGAPDLSKAGLSEEQLKTFFSGGVVEKGIGLKLHDFLDSAIGTLTRTVMGHDIRGMQPAVIDVHASRGVGFIDDTYLAYLQERFGKKAAKLVIDQKSGVPGEPAYQSGVAFYNAVARQLNKEGFDGGGWTAAEVQAVDWTHMVTTVSLPTTGRGPETPSAAFTKNEQLLSFEVEFGSGSPMEKLFAAAWAKLSVEQRTRVTQEVVDKVIPIAKGLVQSQTTSIEYVPGGYADFSPNPSAQLTTLASEARAADLADVIGLLLQQSEVYRTKPQKSGANSITIYMYSDPQGEGGLGDAAVSEAFMKEFTELFPELAVGWRGAQRLGDQAPGIAITVERTEIKTKAGKETGQFRSVKAMKQMIMERLTLGTDTAGTISDVKEGEFLALTDRHNLTIDVDLVETRLEKHGSEGEWETGNGNSYRKSLRSRGRSNLLRGKLDSAAKEVQSIIRAAIKAESAKGLQTPKAKVGERDASLQTTQAPAAGEPGSGTVSESSDQRAGTDEPRLSETARPASAAEGAAEQLTDPAEGQTLLTSDDRVVKNPRGRKGKQRSFTAGEVRFQILDVINSLSSLVRIRVVETQNDLPANVRGRASTIKGMYQPSKKEIWIVAGNMQSVADIEATIQHETFGHFTMSQMPKWKTALLPELKKIILNSDNDAINDAIGVMMGRGYSIEKNGEDIFTEEIVAYLAETMNGRAAVMKEIIARVKIFVRQLGFTVTPTDADVIGLIRTSKRRAERRALMAGGLGIDRSSDKYSEFLKSKNLDRVRKASNDQELGSALEDLAEEFDVPYLSQESAPMNDDLDGRWEEKMNIPQREMSFVDRLKKRLQEFHDNAYDELTQGLLDSGNQIKVLETKAAKSLKIQLADGLLDASASAYKAYSTLRNFNNVMGAVMRHGIPSFKGGQFSNPVNGQGFTEIFQPLSAIGGTSQLRNWEKWMVARRAQRIIQQDKAKGTHGTPRAREKLLDEQLVTETLDWAKTRTAPDGRTYEQVFEEVLSKWDSLNQANIDLAINRGVLDKKEAALWRQYEYVPFWREAMQLEGRSEPGAGRQRIDVGGSGIFKLTGGVDREGDALRLEGNVVESMFMNTAYLLERTYRNEAMKRIAKVGLVTRSMIKLDQVARPILSLNAKQISELMLKAGMINASDAAGAEAIYNQWPKSEQERWATFWTRMKPPGGDVVTVWEKGKPQYYAVTDRMLMRSIGGMTGQQFGGMMSLFRTSKKWLTIGVTVDPAFMIANWIRDTVTTFVVSDVPIKSLGAPISSLREAYNDSPAMLALAYAGRGGGGFYDSHPDQIRGLLKDMGVKDVSGFMKTVVSPKNMLKWWRRVGTASEFGNRVRVYNTLKARWDGRIAELTATGMSGADASRQAINEGIPSPAEAAYQAQDLLNFTRSGDWAATQTMIQIVPFLNARVQGLNRLYRGAKEHPMNFLAKGGGLMMASIALALYNDDDERYDEVSEWDKDTYYHFWVGDEHFRIPKPFESGVIFSTIPERMLRSMKGLDGWDLFAERMLAATTDTFAFNPVPQLVKPWMESYYNTSFFTDSPIIPAGMENLLPERQYDWRTGEFAKWVGDAMPEAAPDWLQSPKRLEHFVRGYFGALGVYAMGVGNVMTESILYGPERTLGELTSKRLHELPVIERFKRGEIPTTTKYNRLIWEMLSEADGLARTLKIYQEEGRGDAAFGIAANESQKLAALPHLRRVTREISAVNKQMNIISMDRRLSPQRRQALTDTLTKQRNALAAQVEPLIDFF